MYIIITTYFIRFSFLLRFSYLHYFFNNICGERDRCSQNTVVVISNMQINSDIMPMSIKNVFCTQCDAIRNLLQRSKHIIPKSMLEMSMSRRIQITAGVQFGIGGRGCSPQQGRKHPFSPPPQDFVKKRSRKRENIL